MKRKLYYTTIIYFVLIIVIRFLFSPEKYIYGHDYEYKFLEFLFSVVLIPLSIGLYYLTKKYTKDKSIGIALLFSFFGFFGLSGSTFIEKLIVNHQLDKEGKIAFGIISHTYKKESGSKFHHTNYVFIVSFNVNRKPYNSLPKSTWKEQYSKGDTIKVKYLERNPFLNKIYF